MGVSYHIGKWTKTNSIKANPCRVCNMYNECLLQDIGLIRVKEIQRYVASVVPSLLGRSRREDLRRQLCTGRSIVKSHVHPIPLYSRPCSTTMPANGQSPIKVIAGDGPHLVMDGMQDQRSRTAVKECHQRFRRR